MLIILFVGVFIVFQLAFYHENFLIVLRTVAALFWFFLLPGFGIMYYWQEQVSLVERMIIGIIVSISITAITAYYLNVLEIHVKYYPELIPAGTLIVASILIWRKIKKHDAPPDSYLLKGS